MKATLGFFVLSSTDVPDYLLDDLIRTKQNVAVPSVCKYPAYIFNQPRRTTRHPLLSCSRSRSFQKSGRSIPVSAPARTVKALQLREKWASTSWKRKANASAWASFLLRNRQTQDPSQSRRYSDTDATIEEVILESLCVADSSSERILEFLSSGCSISCERFESIVTNKESSLSVREQNLVLVQLYKSDGNHHRVVQQLEISPDGGVDQVTDYRDSMLSNADDELDEEVIDTIFNHLGYVLEEAGQDVGYRFLTSGSLPFDKSLAFLRHRRDRQFLLRFLERVQRDPFCACETRPGTVVRMIIRELTDAIKDSPVTAESRITRANLRKKLNEYLKCIGQAAESNCYEPDLVLGMIPDSLYEERVFVLGLLHREHEAIDMLLFEGGCLDAAEQMCLSLPQDELHRSLESILNSTLDRIVAGLADERRIWTTAAFLALLAFPEDRKKWADGFDVMRCVLVDSWFSEFLSKQCTGQASTLLLQYTSSPAPERAHPAFLSSTGVCSIWQLLGAC